MFIKLTKFCDKKPVLINSDNISCIFECSFTSCSRVVFSDEGYTDVYESLDNIENLLKG